MIFRRIIFVLLFCLTTQINSQKLTDQQKAWFYKVVEKSPCLKNNLSQYFTYSGEFQFHSGLPFLSQKEQLTYDASMWDSIEQSIISKPELLTVDWKGVSSTSPGVLAEAAVKLTLWEIYSNIKNGYKENPVFSKNIMAKQFYTEAQRFLPSVMKSENMVKSKYHSDFLILINPSLNYKRKSDVFSKIKKVDVSEQKVYFEKWFALINKVVVENSKKYFDILSNKKVFFEGELLAVGEGSGSAGLLREFEDVNEKYTGTGTGKGIGLFTYKIGIRKGQLELKSTTETKINLLPDEPTLLHLSLWGMDWKKKPLVVIQRGDRSYLLYGGLDFSPDPEWSEGTSYFDVLEEFKARKIQRVIEDLKKESGLLSVYERESRVLNKIEKLIDKNNAEIDSIKELEEPNQPAIQQRLKKNEVYLSNLSAKEVRLNVLQKKISQEYHKINKAEKELGKMKSVLGDSIQTWSWSVKDSIFTFQDGTIFNARTQDLILFNDSSGEDHILVRLLAASYSIYSDKKDEVQLYINVTGGVNDFKIEKSIGVQPDTILRKSFFFNPDEYTPHDLFNTNDSLLLSNIAEEIKIKEFNIKTSFVAMGVDSVCFSDIETEKLNYGAKKDQLEYVKARRVDLIILKQEKDYYFLVNGYTDPGPTTLSKVSITEKRLLGHYKNTTQTLNPALSILRVNSVIKEIKRISGLTFKNTLIEIPVLNKTIESGF